MSSSPVRPYHGESAEARVASRRARLIETAFAQMAEDGWRSMTIDALCREAKLNKRYFYESFESLDALCAAVVDTIATEVIARGLKVARSARDRGLDADALARETLASVVGYLLDDPRRARILFGEVADTERAVAHRRTTIHGLAVTLSTYGHEHHRAPATDPIAEVASALLVGGTIEVIETWLAGGIAMPREQLVDDLAALWIVAGDGAVARAKSRLGPRSR